MRIAIGTDHAGFDLKQQLVRQLRQDGHAVTDVGAHEYDADDDYPDSAFAVAVMRGVIRSLAGPGTSAW